MRKTLTLPLVLLSMLFLMGGCPEETPRVTPPTEPAKKEEVKADDAAELEKLRAEAAAEKSPGAKLEKELAVLKKERDIAARDLAFSKALIKQKETDIQENDLKEARTKFYVGAAILCAITVTLLALWAWLHIAALGWAAIATGGLSCLAVTAGFLSIYVFWIALGGSTIFILALLYMLFGRDRTLVSLSKGVNEIKAQVPNYKEILGKYMSEAEDKLLDKVRSRWKDATLKK